MSQRERTWWAVLLLAIATMVAIGIARSRRSTAPTISTTAHKSSAALVPLITMAQEDELRTGTTQTNTVHTARDLRRELQRLMHEGGMLKQMNAIFLLGQRLAAADFDNAVRLLNDMPENWRRNVLWAGVLHERGRVLGQAAIEELKALHEGEENSKQYRFSVYEDVFGGGEALVGWASVAPQAAFDYASHAENTGTTRLAFAGWAFQDLDGALAHVNALPEGVGSGRGTFAAWAERDPAAVREYISKLPSELQPAVAERVVFAEVFGWNEPYRLEFFSYMAVAMEDESAILDKNFYKWWAQRNGQAATEAGFAADENAGNLAFGTWLDSEPAAALAWAQQHSEGDALLQSIVEHLGDFSPALVCRVLADRPELAKDESVCRQFVNEWSHIDPAGALAWAEQHQLAPAVLTDLVAQIAQNWGSWDTAEAGAWAQSLTDAARKLPAEANVALAQARHHAAASTDWILQLPPGSERNCAVFGYIEGALGETSLPASDLASGAVNLAALGAKVQKSELDDATKQRLQRLIQGW